MRFGTCLEASEVSKSEKSIIDAFWIEKAQVVLFK